ncbi:placenta-specific gene 8 protein-like [Ruditapes philippinarum]|uniref:placenta-specific gene 8 protein-like n=1 Tax=Ruditapes philippinarum TaxID=129788 RepID=UPI00295AF39C|nr:placenta-specific gene 8 protein-like [Ruditapes philippinarum]
MAAQNDETVVMTGGSFTASDESPVTAQPKTERSNSKAQGRMVTPASFDDTLSERDWKTKLCSCEEGNSTKCSLYCCWCYHKYMAAIRLGETPFMGFLPCATFALRVKVRTLFGIKGSIVEDFLTTLFCEPCAICQMSKELDDVGL